MINKGSAWINESINGEYVNISAYNPLIGNTYIELPDKLKNPMKDNLYGWTMIQYLPYSGLKWLNQKEISGFCLNSITENSSIGYILEVDLEYPSELHELHNDYPLAP